VLRAVPPLRAIDETRNAFVRYHHGDWLMPPKVYLPSPPYGDFRAMPALGDGLAVLKWVSSFPGNVGTDVATVNGILCLSDATTGEPLMLLDARAVTALRTGAVAAVAAGALARTGGTVGVIGCGVHGAWAARCMAAAGYESGICADPNPDAAARVAGDVGWRVGTREEAVECDIICCVTPGSDPVIGEADLRPGAHLNMLGADGPGKAEATVDAVAACRLFCDEWAQASHGGELTTAVEKGVVTRDDVTDLGAVLSGEAEGRRSDAEVTLFDSTGLAIQDLAIARAALEEWRKGAVDAPTIEL
jgi:ornithine cyclodeaminase/alanine dehydrogenase-like protein (mu-crystallin family)